MKTIGKILLWLIAFLVVVEIIVVGVLAVSNYVRPNTVLVVRVSGNIPEQPPLELLPQLLAGRPTTFTDLAEALDRARTDKRISGIEVRIGESSLNMAKLQELREKIQALNRAGKFSVAYLEFSTNRPYYLASACQTVIFLPKSLLYVRGLMASTTFYRGTFDKLGISPDFYHIGEYKNAIDVYMRKKYTPPHREAIRSLLEDWNRQFLRGVAEGRGMKPEDVQQAIARGPFTSTEALNARLVDRLGYADESRDLVKQKNRGSDNHVGLQEYLRRTEGGGKSKLAVIYATGTILPGRSGMDPFGDQVMGSDTIAEQFRIAREDDSLKAVILRVDSPGGAPFSSEVIRRELETTKRTKPVVVSMSDVAASGGYWISMSAHKIVAEPGTITGSIGVYSGKFNILGLYSKLGLSKDYVATTDNSTLDWPFKNYTPAQRQSVMRTLRDTYASFIQGVSGGRHLTVQAVERIAQGRVWTGEQAHQLGLVDELGGLSTAVDRAKELAKIPKGEKVSLVYLPRPKSFFAKLGELAEGTSVLARELRPRQWLANLEVLARVPVWALLPAVAEVQ